MPVLFKQRHFFWERLAAWALLPLVLGLAASASAEQACSIVAEQANSRLRSKIDPQELTAILQQLTASANRRLPEKFVTKSLARRQGWQPGQDLWEVPGLEGKSMGGDIFHNREKRLPEGLWREADLDYHGGHRGAKRLLYSTTGGRMLSVDHYRTYIPLPDCK